MSKVLLSDAPHIERYRRFTIVFLLLIAVLTLADIVEDWLEGSSYGHMGIELGIMACAIVTARLLWRSAIAPLEKSNLQLRGELASKSDQLAQFRQENAQLLLGFVEALEQQLVVWGLTPAEGDVALLLLKGLSLKEISSLRQTSERTVRQQAAAVYAKSKLDGRAQLAAYFIESLLEDTPKSSAQEKVNTVPQK
jgi:DNA-binding CsgD family transcriptional regulator